jgi:hypothetical protein
MAFPVTFQHWVKTTTHLPLERKVACNFRVSAILWAMKKITASMDDGAAEKSRGSAVVRPDEFARLKALEAEVRQRPGYYSASSRMKRDELYDRD